MDAHAEVRQRGLDQDPVGEAHRGLDDDLRQHVREDVAHQDRHSPEPQRFCRLDIALGRFGEHAAAHDAEEERRVDDGDGHDRRPRPRAQHGGDADGEQDPGERRRRRPSGVRAPDPRRVRFRRTFGAATENTFCLCRTRPETRTISSMP